MKLFSETMIFFETSSQTVIVLVRRVLKRLQNILVMSL
jgi:hypothetical protein